MEGDVITAHGSVSSLHPIGGSAAGGGRGVRGSSSPDDNTSVCSCTCDRWGAGASGGASYRSGSPSYAPYAPYASTSVAELTATSCALTAGGSGAPDVQHIPLETFYEALFQAPATAAAAAAAAVDPYAAADEDAAQTGRHRSSI